MGNRNSIIQAVAERVRMEFNYKKISKGKLSALYFTYNPEVQGDMFVLEAEKIFPKLNCGLTSVYLRNILGGKVIQGKYDKYRHTFLMVGKQVIDITADQYGGPEVYVGKLKSPWTLI